MIKTDTIPFLDLITLHADFEEDLVGVFKNALRTGGFVGGPIVEAFEQEFAAFSGAKHCVGVANGTDALRFALMAAGIGDGDIVITVPNSFIATTEAISQAGALPAFVDIDEATYNMSPQALASYLEEQCYKDEKSGHWKIGNSAGRWRRSFLCTCTGSPRIWTRSRRLPAGSIS